MKIRQFEFADLEAVVEVFRSNIPKYFGPGEEHGLRDFLKNYSEHYFVCDVDGEVVGAGGFAANSEDYTVSLCWGMVHGDYLGKGLGRELTEFRILKARETLGPLPLVISTSQHTQGFYEKFGFVLTRHEPDGFGPGIDICEMRRD